MYWYSRTHAFGHGKRGSILATTPKSTARTRTRDWHTQNWQSCRILATWGGRSTRREMKCIHSSSLNGPKPAARTSSRTSRISTPFSTFL